MRFRRDQGEDAPDEENIIACNDPAMRNCYRLFRSVNERVDLFRLYLLSSVKIPEHTYIRDQKDDRKGNESGK